MRMDSNIDNCRRVRTTGRATATWPGESRSCAATTASTGYRTASTRSADIFYWLPNIFVCVIMSSLSTRNICLSAVRTGAAFSLYLKCKCIFWYCIAGGRRQHKRYLSKNVLAPLKVFVNLFNLDVIFKNYLSQVKKCPRCKKELKPVVKIAKQLQQMHRDFRGIMDRINDNNAEANLKKFSSLLVDIEKLKFAIL